MPKKPFYRAFDDWWYAQLRVGGKRIQKKLVKGKANEADAYRAFCRLMAEQSGKVPEPEHLAVATVCDLFLDHSQAHHEPASYRWYKKFFQDFCGQYGRLVVADLKPFHANRWADSHAKWNSGGKRAALSALKRAFNWAEGEGLIRGNPFRGLKKPPARRRDRLLTPEERTEILAAIKDRQFREFVYAMQETGCRPSEVARVSVEHVNLPAGVWVFRDHKTSKKTGRVRVVYLTPAMVELTKQRLAEYPTGPLFRGPRLKRPFSRNAIRCRFRNLRTRLPHLKGVISYSYRHAWITDALGQGLPDAVVAELAGHTSTDTIHRHYAHLSQRAGLLREAAIKARSA